MDIDNAALDMCESCFAGFVHMTLSFSYSNMLSTVVLVLRCNAVEQASMHACLIVVDIDLRISIF